jgi:hypothetical protein
MTIGMTKEKDKFKYPIFSQRISKENKNWLKNEKQNYPSWNKFFDELRKRYNK